MFWYSRKALRLGLFAPFLLRFVSCFCGNKSIAGQLYRRLLSPPSPPWVPLLSSSSLRNGYQWYVMKGFTFRLPIFSTSFSCCERNDKWRDIILASPCDSPDYGSLWTFSFSWTLGEGVMATEYTGLSLPPSVAVCDLTKTAFLPNSPTLFRVHRRDTNFFFWVAVALSESPGLVM